MPYIDQQYLIGPTTTPEQKNFINWFYSQFNNRSAANRQIINVEPIYFSGLIAGSEFLTYAATKLYLGLYIKTFVAPAVNFAVASAYLSLWDETGATAMIQLYNLSLAWDVTAIGFKATPNPAEISNVYFSKATLTIYNYFIFNGYRITLQ
jgi:hypothetical protein